MATLTLSRAQIRRLRLRAQLLQRTTWRAPSTVTQIVRGLVAIQAQEPPSASLAIRPRAKDLLASQVVRALEKERTIVRTWCMRGTLHLIAAQDIGWLLALLGPILVRKSRRRYSQLGLDDELSTRALEAIRTILGSQCPLTRAQLAGQLAERGIPTEGQAAYHLLRRAGLEGVVCFGPDYQGEPTYVLLDDWADKGAVLPADVARARLARRYLEAYGPAGPRDLATWSGLSMKDASAGFEAISDELTKVTIDESPAWLLKAHASWLEEAASDQPSVLLLPAYDPYMLGYHGRELSVPQRYAKRLHPGGGLFRPALFVDGRASGRWQLKRKKGNVVIRLEPFEELRATVTRALEQEVGDIGRYYETKATIAPPAER